MIYCNIQLEFVLTDFVNLFNFICLGNFLSRISILTRDIDIANLTVCSSVRYVRVPYENGLTYRHSFFTILSQIVTIEGKWETATKLSNGTNLNDFE